MSIVTARTVADACGVSPATVSRILGKQAHLYRPETRRRVLEASSRLGYRINTSARAIRRQRFGQVAMLTRHEIGEMHFNVNKGAFLAAAAHDLHLTYAEVDFDRLTDPLYAPKVLSEFCADGFLVHYAWAIPQAAIERIRGYGVPVVWINTKTDSNCVYPDEFGGARAAVADMIARGRRRVVYLPEHRSSGPPRGIDHHYSIADRERGYADAMLDAGLAPRIERPPPARPLDAAAELAEWRAWLAGRPDVDAVLCYGAREATGVYAAALAEGRTPGKGLDVRCFHYKDQLSGSSLRPEVVHIPMADVGRRATEMLAELIDTGESEVPAEAVPYRFARAAAPDP